MGERISLKRLNLRKPKEYDYGMDTETVKPRIRFYCIAEGATEESYLEVVKNNKVFLKIKNEVVIEVIKKEDEQKTMSHPMQLVKAALTSMGRIDAEGKEVPPKEWKNQCQWDKYDSVIDEVCVVFDRDYKNLENHLDEIYKLCKKHEIQIIMSNPNFELWLLMHFPEISQYDPQKLQENRKNLGGQIDKTASKKKKYLEILVARNAEGYKKGSSLKFERFMPGIELAMEQAKLFCENPKELRDNPGSSMGRLLSQMKE